MNGVSKEIFRAIHEGKWLSIEYRNKDGKVTKYWIGIKDLDLKYKRLIVDGLHLGELTVAELKIYIDSIQQASIVEGSFCPVNQELVHDIMLNPHKYAGLFEQIPNLKILNYLADCNRLDTTPFNCEYRLVKFFDDESFSEGQCMLTDEQFSDIVREFQYEANDTDGKIHMKQLGLNVISVNCREGLYILAYRKLRLDVTKRCMRADETITYNREFTVNGEKLSISRFMEIDDLELLDDPGTNIELVKDYITLSNPQIKGVNDLPYVFAIARNLTIDLDAEYSGIMDMYSGETVSAPIHAFFGEFLTRPVRRRQYPLALFNRKLNLDQLLAINNAMKYPLTYVQGPPGTGKTNTILNTILTAFFNERTVLFASSNNHPIDEVYKKLQRMNYQGKRIPFPMVRLGNNSKVNDALDHIRRIYEQTKGIKIYDTTLGKNREDRIHKTSELTKLLAAYEEILDLRERKEVTEKLLEESTQLNFQYELQGRQLVQIDKRLHKIGEIRDEDALRLIQDDTDELLKYLFYTSAKYIKRLDEPKNEELLKIVMMDAKSEERVSSFNRYLSEEENVRKFQRIFPLVATTCISAHKIGPPKPYFDMVIMDEASQCNVAVSLVPIIRGENLLLVGDPQQLQPVILVDRKDNEILRKRYGVAPEYDYIENSIYKTYLACDPVSDEILLRSHYRCHPKIIGFNNKKYYNNRLHIKTYDTNPHPLTFVDVRKSQSSIKNTAPGEAAEILHYVEQNPGKKIGIITPFVNQKTLINDELNNAGIRNAYCGTVHAFQGDEKDIILFSLGISDSTKNKTYGWLKNNRELINVATSRAREKLVVFGSGENLRRLHAASDEDDLYELIEYIKSNGESEVSQKTISSRALGIKPYSTETETAFLETLSHAIDVLQPSNSRYAVHKEVPVSQVFQDNTSYANLFYTGRFDFVVYEKTGGLEIPVLAIELDGKEHLDDEVVKIRDRQKNQICRDHQFELIRVKNTYARRYHYIKDILINYFGR